MTEQEKRYVAEKMLGWAEWTHSHAGHFWVANGKEVGALPDFTQLEYLGLLWEALCERCAAQIEGTLEKWGTSIHALANWQSSADRLKERLDEAAGGFPDGFMRKIDNTIQVLQNLKESVR